ncbi:MAG: hypothetical protein FWG66_08530 [Spirochaetes bacterium]|nr:hypothetical protein [Spirochaetota bacterium]
MILVTPTGKDIFNPTSDNIREVLKKDSEYWLDGCGQISLSKGKVEDSEIVLLVFRDKKHGFVVMNMDARKAVLGERQEKDLFAVLDDGGGMPLLIPLCCFVGEAQAEQVLLHFLETAECLNYENWHDIDEGYDSDDFVERFFDSCDFDKLFKVKNGKLEYWGE